MTTRQIAALAGAIAMGLAMVGGGMATGVAAAPSRDVDRSILDQHNQERSRYGLAGLTWSPKLEREAQVWANELARTDSMYHSTREQRGATGENLWSGTKDYFTVSQMMNGFLSERRNFNSGIFPAVSRTGNWADVGHYTQIIWADTREVGCAIAQSRARDYLVCRYFPAGNVQDQPVG